MPLRSLRSIVAGRPPVEATSITTVAGAASDGNAFFGYNYQQRKYADFSAWGSLDPWRA